MPSTAASGASERPPSAIAPERFATGKSREPMDMKKLGEDIETILVDTFASRPGIDDAERKKLVAKAIEATTAIKTLIQNALEKNGGMGSPS
jgi:hypothetical protein